ncbi:unnamed protein product [Adineta ricciae]|uniref:Glutamate--cysteine ligase n=1 Tax=Adineta ricciae TaxID=249248 RepID=A0A815T9J6_ADIRI|nr:unnamed protein product [Adineta ricciae]
MGVLSAGRPLTWKEIVEVRTLLKNDACNDLIKIFRKHSERKNDPFLWGDEIEYSLVRFDHENQHVQLLLKADELLAKLNENLDKESCPVEFHAEDCNFVIEGIPSIPYSSQISSFPLVETNMKSRREVVQRFLNPNEFILTFSAFPRLGCFHCTYPEYESDPLNSFEYSLTCSDYYKTPEYPRTMFLNKNVIERRQGKVSVNVPIMKDTNTSDPFEDDFSSYGVENWQKYVETRQINHIHLDSSSIGWGCSCLQVTLQASSFHESLLLYDQLIPLTPLFLSLSTSCPIWRGYLSEVDSRWNILSKTTDDRTNEELNENLIEFSRYASVPCYLLNSSESFNDLFIHYDKEIYEKLIENNCPSVVAKHFAHLFIRDPLYVTDQQVNFEQNSSTNLFKFENHNSMIWNSLRFKPPVTDEMTSLGWRIEFRPMELQLTDFENAALSVFLILLTRSILSFEIDLRIPISLIHENMQRAQVKNTIQQMKFYFRKQNHICEMTIDEIINGSENYFGLKSLVLNYLNSFEDIDISTRQTMNEYIEFISQRAKGDLLSNAMWMRKSIENHHLYQHDSIVSEQIQYDLFRQIEQIANQKQLNLSHLISN